MSTFFLTYGNNYVKILLDVYEGVVWLFYKKQERKGFLQIMRRSGSMIRIIIAAVAAAVIMVVGIADMINSSNTKSKSGIILFLIGLAVLILLAVIYIFINKKKKQAHVPQKNTKNRIVHVKSGYRIRKRTPAKPASAVPEPAQRSSTEPEDFFESIDRRSEEKKKQPEPKAEPKPKSEPKPVPQPQSVSVLEKEMSGLNTDHLDIDGLEDLDKPNVNHRTPVVSSAGDMSGVDLSGLDTDSLGSYVIETTEEESDSEYYSNDDYYTVDAASSEIKLSEMDE